MTARQFGVEEELLLVHPETGVPTAVATLVLDRAKSVTDDSAADDDAAVGDDAAADHGAADRAAGPDEPRGIEKELQQQQIEIDTAPVGTVAELRTEIRRLRGAAAEAAGRADALVAALGTSPVAVDPAATPVSRYEQMIEIYRLTAEEQLTCGMHVHVETESPAEAVGALDRVRPWLPLLLALSANSPFWQGRDSGYESFRAQAWSRWPSAGPTDAFGSERAYRDAIAAMLDSGALLDDGMVYFDARLGRSLPTLEVRVADVCLDAEDSVLVAALTRALVDTAARDWRADEPVVPVRIEVLRLAAWRASRSGLRDVLVDPRTGRQVAAAMAIGALREHVRDSLDEAGDLAEVDELLARLWHKGSGSSAQRAAYARNGSLADVVRDAVERTLGW